MNLLAIDTACSILSVAVARENEIFYFETEAGVRHSELVMDCIESQMKKALLKPEDISGILCMGGPGSFTGLRIGFSTAKGLALALSRPFAAIPTLDCIAWRTINEQKEKLTLAVIEARKNAYFYTFYSDGKRLKPDEDAGITEITREIEKYQKTEPGIALTGPGADSLYDLLPQELKKNLRLDYEKRGFAKELISIAKKQNILDNVVSAFLYSGPEYIRKTDAETAIGQSI